MTYCCFVGLLLVGKASGGLPRQALAVNPGLLGAAWLEKGRPPILPTLHTLNPKPKTLNPKP